MKEYITFHQVTLDTENLGVKKLFGLNTNISVGVQQCPSAFLRNPKNPKQIEIPEKINIVEHEYNRFPNTIEAFETIKSFIYNEFKINEKHLTTEKKSGELFFYVFEQEEEKPKLRGVLHATISAMKPLYYIAFTKSLEFEYDRELYKKW